MDIGHQLCRTSLPRGFFASGAAASQPHAGRDGMMIEGSVGFLQGLPPYKQQFNPWQFIGGRKCMTCLHGSLRLQAAQFFTSPQVVKPRQAS